MREPIRTKNANINNINKTVKTRKRTHTHTHVRARACTHMLSYLWDPVDCSPPGSSVHGIFQARILECVAMSYSRGSS